MNISKIFRLINVSTRASKELLHSRSWQKVNNYRTLTNASISQGKKEKEEFQDVLPGMIDHLLSSHKFQELPEVQTWIKKLLEYTLEGGKKNRGLTTVFAYEMLEKPENLTEESLRNARILGWCVEMLQAYFIVIDDIMDGSVTRRGVPCWYRLPDVGLGALNDSIFIYSSLYQILKTHFGDKQQYSKIVDLFNETLLYTSMGQHLDYSMAHRNKTDYSLFTIERYNAIVKYKTSFYTIKLPVCLGLLLVNNTDPEIHKKAEEICLDIGQIFQIQDDYLDCFGSSSKTGKVGTDIQEGKCSWLAVNALQRCSENQRKVFTTCYGSSEPAHVERIKQLYEDLRLPALYDDIEKEHFSRITEKVNRLPPPLVPEIFHKILNLLYNRKS